MEWDISLPKKEADFYEKAFEMAIAEIKRLRSIIERMEQEQNDN